MCLTTLQNFLKEDTLSVPSILTWNEPKLISSDRVNDRLRFISVDDSFAPLDLNDLSTLETDAVWIVEADTMVVTSVSSIESSLGYDSSSLIGTKFYDTIIDEDVELVKELMTDDPEVFVNRIASVIICRKHRFSNSLVEFESRWRCQASSNGIPERFVIVERQITNDSTNERAREMFWPSTSPPQNFNAEFGNQNFSNNFENSISLSTNKDCENMIICIDLESADIVSVNGMCLKGLGFSPQEMIGYNYFDFIEFDDHQALKGDLKNLKDLKNEICHMNFRRFHKNGTVLNVECKATILYSKDSSSIVCTEKVSVMGSSQTNSGRTDEDTLSMNSFQSETNSVPVEIQLNELADLTIDFVYLVEMNENSEKMFNYDSSVVRVNEKAIGAFEFESNFVSGAHEVQTVVPEDLEEVRKFRNNIFSKFFRDLTNSEDTKISHRYTRKSASGKMITVEALYCGVFKHKSNPSKTSLDSVLIMEKAQTMNPNAINAVTESANGNSINTKKRPNKSKKTNKRPNGNSVMTAVSQKNALNPVKKEFLKQYLGLVNEDVNAPMSTLPELRYPLIVSSSTANLFKMSLLIAMGADCDMVPSDVGYGAIHTAVMYGSIPCVILLVANGANVDSKAEIEGETFTPLGIACKEGFLQMAEVLIKLGANVNMKDSEGNTALHFVVELDNIELVKLMLDNGADVSIANNEGFTPMSLVNNDGNISQCRNMVIEHSERRAERIREELLASL